MKFVVLCEDTVGACFARRFLWQRGVGKRDIKEDIAPSGKGCGAQYVREKYPDWMQAQRKGNAPGFALIVLMDADKRSVTERIAELDDACRLRDIRSRASDQPVMFAVPKRNIETWLQFLDGQSNIDEETDYAGTGSHRADKVLCERAAQKLKKLCDRARQSPSSVDFQRLLSLQAACQEAPRVGWCKT